VGFVENAFFFNLRAGDSQLFLSLAPDAHKLISTTYLHLQNKTVVDLTNSCIKHLQRIKIAAATMYVHTRARPIYR